MSRNFLKTSLSYLAFALLTFLFSNCNKDSDSTPAFDAAKQALIDDTILSNYLYIDSNDVQALKTSSGLYYSIKQPQPDSLILLGDTLPADTGDFVFVRYEGRLLSDTIFDSNLLSSRAFIFEVGLPSGSRSVIAGLDEGILKFRKGQKGYIYIRSGLAYGNISQAKIPANSCLKFFIYLPNIE